MIDPRVLFIDSGIIMCGVVGCWAGTEKSSFPEQSFNSIAALAAKQKQTPGKYIKPKILLHDSRKTVYCFTHPVQAIVIGFLIYAILSAPL